MESVKTQNVFVIYNTLFLKTIGIKIKIPLAVSKQDFDVSTAECTAFFVPSTVALTEPVTVSM